MTSPPRPRSVRHPLPALVFLLALTVLAALVWWRVLTHDDPHAIAEPVCTPSPSPSPTKITELPEQAAITVHVLNSTDRAGIAGKAQATLHAKGFHTPVRAANDGKIYPGYDGEVPGVADIRFGPEGRRGALLVRYYLPHSKLVPTKQTDATVLVSLGKKYHGVASTPHVESKLAKAGIKLVRVTGAAPPSKATATCAPGTATASPGAPAGRTTVTSTAPPTTAG